jgi:hypothetical protein
MKSRYSDLYKRKIHGDDCCPFWDSKYGGTCMSASYAMIGGVKGQRVDCTSNEDGSGCQVFSTCGI